MTNLSETHIGLGAQLAADGIPLQYSSLETEYQAALHQAVLMDRSHEGRLLLTGADRLVFMHRISTNDLLNMAQGEGRPTLFTNPNARIIDRATVYHRGESALVITEAGRGEALRQYLQRNIFFNDKARIEDISGSTNLFVLHGPQADHVVSTLLGGQIPEQGAEVAVAGVDVFIARRKPLSVSQWVMVVPSIKAAEVWNIVLEAGKTYGLIPAGSLAYNVLRIRAGRPAAGRELTTEYSPLEVGLWDEVNFHKGCYTGQEIIARMESRNRLARTIVSVELEALVPAPAELTLEGRVVGTLTSSVSTPEGLHVGIAVIKLQAAQIGSTIKVGGVKAVITALAGVQPAHLMPEEA
ncbi:MAG: glycine cleavage system protein T [Anaerolineae bacterium]